MWVTVFSLVLFVNYGFSYPSEFLTQSFKVGIEYEHSLPMSGNSNRHRHINNYDPFFVTVTASARKGYVLDYLEVKATVDAGGEVDFRLVQGQAGTSKMVFQLVSNHSDFLAYSYMSYGIREEEYRKMANHIMIPFSNKVDRTKSKNITLISLITSLYWLFYLY